MYVIYKSKQLLPRDICAVLIYLILLSCVVMWVYLLTLYDYFRSVLRRKKLASFCFNTCKIVRTLFDSVSSLNS